MTSTISEPAARHGAPGGRRRLRQAELAGPSLVRAGHQDWFGLLDAERANLRRAVSWAIQRGETELALRFTGALWRYWRELGELPVSRGWGDFAPRLPGD